MRIAIAIPCYKRIESLRALLASLTHAAYDVDRVDLVLSIDYSGSDAAVALATKFEWPFGNKRLVRHETNIGLRKNILFCGDLTREYDAVIVIEDDLIVAHSFYRYARRAAEFYAEEDRVAGISLYQYELEELTWSRFQPLYEGYDTYFIRWPSSWGQLWTRSQWSKFRTWYKDDPDISGIAVPACVKRWQHSWKKYYAAYLVATDRYLVFPFYSYIYNGIVTGGIHTYKMPCVVTASQFNYFDQREFRFPLLEESRFRYDAYFQLERRVVRIGNKEYDLQFDLQGNRMETQAPYVVTSRRVAEEKVIASFEAGMLPLELNILENRPGDMFRLIHRDDFDPCSSVDPFKIQNLRRVMEWRALLLCAVGHICEKTKDKLNRVFRQKR